MYAILLIIIIRESEIIMFFKRPRAFAESRLSHHGRLPRATYTLIAREGQAQALIEAKRAHLHTALLLCKFILFTFACSQVKFTVYVHGF